MPLNQQDSLQPHVDRLADNIVRVHNLVSIYQALAGPKPGRRSVGVTDVLRSAVVLLHASLEEFLRSLARKYLPHASPEVVDRIPLKRSAGSYRAQKILLGHLIEHRGKTVDSLIEESVEEYLQRSNYNNTTEIAVFMRNLGLDPEGVQQFFTDLDKMMQRRHQIVHRADCTASTGRGRHKAHTIQQKTVENWISTVVNFHQAVLYQLQMKQAESTDD